MSEEVIKREAKINRRTAKAALTRCGKTVSNLISGKRPESEVKISLAKYQENFEHLVELHEQYVKLIEDDNEFDKEEEWLGQCQEVLWGSNLPQRFILSKTLVKGKRIQGLLGLPRVEMGIRHRRI